MGVVRHEAVAQVASALQKRTGEASITSLVSEVNMSVDRVAKAVAFLLEKECVTSRDGPRGPFRWKSGATIPVSKGKDGAGKLSDVESLLKHRLARHTTKADIAKAALMHHEREAKKIAAALKALAQA